MINLLKIVASCETENIDIGKLRIGDIFYLSGMLATGRDEVYHRVVE